MYLCVCLVFINVVTLYVLAACQSFTAASRANLHVKVIQVSKTQLLKSILFSLSSTYISPLDVTLMIDLVSLVNGV